jgi:hypothetical protein
MQGARPLAESRVPPRAPGRRHTAVMRAAELPSENDARACSATVACARLSLARRLPVVLTLRPREYLSPKA